MEERAHAAQVEAAEARVRAAEERKARKLTLALGAAVLGLVVVGSGGWLWVQNERAAQERAEVERQRVAAARDRELSDEVNATLNEAATLRGGGRFAEAIAAIERAHALAEVGGASDDLLTRVDASLAETRAAKTQADERAELARDTRELLAELRDIGRADAMGGGGSDAALAYEETFLAHGLDLDAGELEVAARSLTERGLGSDIALVLDAWAARRRAEEDEAGAVRLMDLAHAVDPDPVRANLREALANEDLSELEFLAETGLDDQPARTIMLIAAGLEQLGAEETALSVYRTGVDRHPDDFGLLYALADLLVPDGPDAVPDVQIYEAREYTRAALALSPESSNVRWRLGGLNMRLGRFERALQLVESVDAHPGDFFLNFMVARIYMLAGRFGPALEGFEVLAEDPDFLPWIRAWSLNNIAVMKLEIGDLEGGMDAARRSWREVPPGSNRSLLSVFVRASAASDSDEPMLEARALAEATPDPAAAANSLAWRTVEFVTRGDEPRALEGSSTRSSLVPPAGSSMAELLLTHAVELGERAVALAPTQDTYWNTLGVARYYIGDHEGAVAALLKDPGYVGSWLYLAMAYQALGREDAAMEWYERAAASMDATPSIPYLHSVRDEARRALGVR